MLQRWLRSAARLVLMLVLGCAHGGPGARNPSLDEDHNKAGLAHLQAGRYDEAEAEFSEALKAEPKSATYKLNLGLVRIEQDRLSEARDLLLDALQLASEKSLKASITMDLGWISMLEGDPDAALIRYKETLSLNPIRAGVRNRMVDVALEKGTLDKAVDDLEKAAKEAKPTDAEGANKVFLPEQAILYALTLQGKYADVVERASRDLDVLHGVKADKEGHFLIIPTPFFVYWRKTGPTHFNTAPIRDSLLNYRGNAYLKQGMLEEAFADFRQTAADNGPNGYLALGEAELERENPNEAVYHLRRYTEARPRDATGLLYYAAALHLSGDVAAADEVLKQMQERTIPKWPPLKCSLEIVKAQAFVDQAWGHDEKALAGYARVLEANPAYGQVYRRMGEILLKRGDKTRAGELLKKAVELSPQDVRARMLAEEAGVATVMPAAAPAGAGN
jgi:tetratricopeptide (TPR) repeat protein